MKHFKLFGKTILSYGEDESNIHNKVYSGVMAAGKDYTKPLSLKQLRNTVISEPLLYKAISKKNLDIVRNWFEIKSVKDDEEVPDKVLDLIYDFNERTNFAFKLNQAGRCANIYGTGFLERTFSGEKNPRLDSKPNSSRKPLGLVVHNPECIMQVKQKERSADKTWYWVYKDVNSFASQEILIHPERLVPVIHDSLPFSKFGISKANICKNILNSKMDADVSSGETLNWFGSGMYDLTINDMQDDQYKAAEKNLMSHPDYLIHDQEYVLDVKNPTRIDPAPFYDYFYQNIAAVMVMPTHMLTGTQLGNVTGSETGFSDYIHDIENIQKVILSPLIKKIYKQLLNSNGFTWKYKILWNPSFIDELSEAKILQTRSFSAVQNVNANIISREEARVILNDGVTHLNPKDVPEEKPSPVVKPVGVEPNPAPQPVVKPKQDKPKMSVVDITVEQEQVLLDKMRLDGIREMEEQERRLMEAKRLAEKKIREEKHVKEESAKKSKVVRKRSSTRKSSKKKSEKV